jgi:hypothetical protein
VNFSSGWLLLLSIPLAHTAGPLGIKMTTQYGGAGPASERTIYLQEDRKRMEYQNSFGMNKGAGSIQPVYGPHIVSIVRCDLGQSFELNLDTREYSSGPYPPKALTKEQLKARGLDTPVTYVSDKTILRIEVTTTDTGERKEIFGHTARRVITTRRQIPLEGSASRPQESVTDAWYIDSNSNAVDLHQRLSCDRKWPEGKQSHAYLHAGGGKQPIDRPEFITVGEPERGFALNSVTTTKSSYLLPDGTIKQMDSRMETQVIQFEEGPLDRALFEIPPGFKQVDHIEHNPPASAFARPPGDFWQRLKDGVAGLFSH